MLELENQAKGMHGNYSIIGKISAEQYPLIMNKEKFLTGKEPKAKKNLFLSEEENEKKNFRSKDELDPFTLPPNYEHEKYKKLVFGQRRELCDPNYSNPNNKYEKWKYHQIHHKIDSQKEHFVMLGPNCTKYSPKYDKIFPRSISGPKWEDDRNKSKRKRKKKNNKNDSSSNDKNNKNNINEEEEEEDDTEGNFYTKHGDLEPENIFVILKKQTMRGPNSTDHDTRIRRDKAFITESDLNIFDNELTTTGNTSSVTSTLPKHTSTKTKYKTKTNSYLKKQLPKHQQTFNKKNSIANNTSTNIYNLNIKDIKAPDFNNYISRATLDFISRDKEPVRPFFVPDYSYTIPRLINAVNYSQSLKKTIVQSRMKGLNENPVWDPDKVYYKISNHKEPSALDFNLMVSRPNEGNLPSYMIRKFDRNSLYDITDKSLKLNRFSDGKFMTDYSSFRNKKSFNDKINKELMNSETLINSNLNDIVDYIKGDINDNRRKRNKIKNVMEYYNRNFDKRNDINNNNNNVMWKSMDNKNEINKNNNIKNMKNNDNNENKKKKMLPNYNNRYEIKF
jgi:hypothetical protein